ncbi:MAG: Lrp/AsnC family transcriptional regulator [Halobacteriaceae archaeon]
MAADADADDGDGESPALDDLDLRLVNALVADPRASLRSVARTTDVAATTASTRVHDLQRRGVIGGFDAVIDYAELGFVTALLRVSVAGPREAASERLAAAPAVTSVYEVTGACDVLAVGSFPDSEALDETVADLRALPAVEAVEASVVREAPLERRPVPVRE